MRQIQKYATLLRADPRLLLAAAFWLCLGRLALLALPFQDILRKIESINGSGTVAAQPAAAARIVWAVDTASRYLPGMGTCLPRALAAAVLLRRAGLPAQVRVGVARGEDGSPEAHAWVECGGQVVIGCSELERYTLISVLRGAGE